MSKENNKSKEELWLELETLRQENATLKRLYEKDISEYQRAEEAFRETNAYLENLINYANAPIIVWDPEFHITRFNHAFETLTGRSEEEVLGQSLEILFPNSRASQTMLLIQRTLTGERWETVEIEILHKDESIRTVLWNSATLFSTDGHTPLAIIAQGQDITERKKVEEKLKESENRFSLFMDFLPALVFIKDSDSRTIYVNNSMEKALGANKWIGLKMPEIFNDEIAARIINDDIKAMQCGYQRIEESYPNLDGQLHHYETQKFIIPRSNQEPLIGGIAIDITERKRADEALRSTEVILSKMVSNISDVIGIIGVDGIMKYKSPNSEKIFGWKPEDIIGTDGWSTVHHEDLERIQKEFFILLQHDNSVRTVEYKYKCKDGSYRPIELTATNLTNDPIIQGVLLNYHDITERKKVEDELRESEEKYRLLNTSMDQGMALHKIITDPDGKPIDYIFLDINDSYTKLLGVTREMSIGKRIKEVMPNVEQYWIDIFGKVALTGESSYYENYLERTGKYYSTYSYCPKMNHFAVLVSDITERKRAEEALMKSELKYRSLIENTRDVVFCVNDKGEYQFTNNVFASTFGKTPEYFIGKTFWDVYPKEEADYRQAASKRMFETGIPQSLEVSVPLPDRTLHFIAKANPVKDETGKVIMNITTATDITDRKMAEIELEKHRNHLEYLVKTRTVELNEINKELLKSIDKEKELSVMKSRFISTTSHEFRTPLTAVLSSTELLQKYMNNWSDDKRNEHFERIKNSVSYLTKLLNDILTVSRTETKEISYNPQQVDLYNCAEECTKDAELLMTDKHQLKFDYQLDQKEFYLDPKLMKFILNNLLSNAIKYSLKGGRVELKIHGAEKYLFIEVKDEGIGIQAEETEKIFNSFYRTREAENIPGNGLGLAIVKSAVDLHKGEITVTSEIGKGTSFTVKIPVTAT